MQFSEIELLSKFPFRLDPPTLVYLQDEEAPGEAWTQARSWNFQALQPNGSQSLQASVLKVDDLNSLQMALAGDAGLESAEIILLPLHSTEDGRPMMAVYETLARMLEKGGFSVFLSEWEHAEVTDPVSEAPRRTVRHKGVFSFPVDWVPSMGHFIAVARERTDDFRHTLARYREHIHTIKQEADVTLRLIELRLRQARNALRDNDYDKAREHLEVLLHECPDLRDAYLASAELLTVGWNVDKWSIDKAVELVNEAVRRYPDDQTANDKRFEILVKQRMKQSVDLGRLQLEAFKDKHKGQRCVIIGNGPSLNKMDLSFLQHEVCFGLNRIYLAFERFGFVPDYLVSVNKFVIEQCATELMAAPCTKFISMEGVPKVRPSKDLVIINPRYWREVFSTDPRQGICIGSTVTYVAMQLAYWMGFEEVVLIGVDHRFQTQGPAHKLIESEGDDPNHFDPQYFGKGFKWQLPDLENSEQMYKLADAYFRAFRHRIVDATVDGACPVFEKMDYRTLFFPPKRFQAPRPEAASVPAPTAEARPVIGLGAPAPAAPVQPPSPPKPRVREGIVHKYNLGDYHNRHHGQRCFIIGNGPSLNKLDLTHLRNEVTFGVNSIYLNREKMGFLPTYYVVEDKLVAEDRAAEINDLSGTVKFFGRYLDYVLEDGEEVVWLPVQFNYANYPGFPHFSRDARQLLWVGGTVSYLCMQLAYYMGFTEVYLVGFDHEYHIPKEAKVNGTEILSTTDDPNHFHPNYFGKGYRWHDPRLDRMEKAYARARSCYENSGRLIRNATAGGKLEIFERTDYASIVSRPAPQPVPAPAIVHPDKPEMSVVICTRRNPLYLACCLESLTRQTLSRDQFEVILIDNDSGDETEAIASSYPEFRYRVETKLGLSHARNAGVDLARGQIICFTDDDAEADPRWLQALLSAYQRHPRCWAAGGKSLPIWGAPKPKWIQGNAFRALSLIDWGDEEKSLAWPERVIGVNCSFRREVFQEIGRFDVDLGRKGELLLGAEDTEIQRLIHERHKEVYYVPTAVVRHHVPPSRMTKEYFDRRLEGTALTNRIMSEKRQANAKQLVGVGAE